MKTWKLLSIGFLALLVACGSEDETVYDEKEELPIPTADYGEMTEELNQLEADIKKDPQNEELLKTAINRFQDFAHFWPEDPKSPDYLFKASDFSMAVNQPAKGVKLLERIMNEYPDYELMIDVEYNYASHLDWELRDTTRAKQAYQSFIDKYPEDNRAADAAIRIKYIRYGWDEYTEKLFNGEIEPVVL